MFHKLCAHDHVHVHVCDTQDLDLTKSRMYSFRQIIALILEYLDYANDKYSKADHLYSTLK